MNNCCVELHIDPQKHKSIRVKGIQKENILLRETAKTDADNDFFQLDDLTQIRDASPYTDLRIFYKGKQPLLENEKEEREVRLHLLRWLISRNQEDARFDCFSFANALHGEKFPRPVDHSFTVHAPRTGECRRASLEPLAGDLIAFYNSATNNILHFAVCISSVHDLYLSKYGHGGPLYATTLQSKCHKYGCDVFFPVVQICKDCKCAVTSEILTIKCSVK